MKIQNPMQWVDRKDRKKVLLTLLLANILILAIFGSLDLPLKTGAAPFGIVSFEIAGSLDNASQILNSWDMTAKLSAAFGLGLDYLFMVVYATFIGLICLMTSERHTGWFSSVGSWLGWGAILAALFDSMENIALWNMLSGANSLLYPPLAKWCALLKFSLLIPGILYPVLGYIFLIYKNRV